MKRIASYHPTIEIKNGTKAATVELDMDDYYTEEEVVQALKESTGARTAGEAVRVIKSGRPVTQSCDKVLAARILDSVQGELQTMKLDWDQDLAEV